jgi:deoxyribodipyrimidine photo-lyase
MESLFDLDKSLKGRLNVYHTKDSDISVLDRIRKDRDIKSITFNRDVTPFAKKRDAEIEEWCKKHDIALNTYDDYLLRLEPYEKQYRVFTPFYKFYKRKVKQTSKVPLIIKSFEKHNTYKCDLYKNHKSKLNKLVTGGRTNANLRNIPDYGKTRDDVNVETSQLGPYINFGCLSIREVYDCWKQNEELVRQLFWREFYYRLIDEEPRILSRSEAFYKTRDDKWKKTSEKDPAFQKWCKGETGVPLIDASMRSLNATGYLHNRLRMVVASYLVKDLKIDWRLGEKFFATQLTDYSSVSNNSGWQHIAGTGASSMMQSRKFNPYRQAKLYDKGSEFINKWAMDV